MSVIRFSRKAKKDLVGIGEYTLHAWGNAQATHYLDNLEKICATLANNPDLGRTCNEVRPGLRRHEHGQHVVFYRPEPNGILIPRILHQRMLPEKHGIDGPSD
jgi:toxin ParE1/3/4